MRNTIASSILAVCLLAMPALARNDDTIRAAQQALKNKGVDAGPVDVERSSGDLLSIAALESSFDRQRAAGRRTRNR